MACLYSTAFPLGIPVSMGGLILTYWTDKYMLLRRHSMPNKLSADLAFEMNDTLELVPVFYAIGNLVFMYIIVPSSAHNVPDFIQDIRIEAWVGVGLSILFYMFPC